MIAQLGALARPLLARLDPEMAHAATIAALRLWPAPRPAPDDPRLAVSAFGLRFLNPIGLAAGFDKNAEATDALQALGFGFVEVGTVTPRPQAGNPRPRVFRLRPDHAIINRLGFNGAGHAAVLSRFPVRGIVGVNIGANKDSADRAADYVAGVTAFASVAAYLTINISSPNTPALRDLQQADALDDLLARVMDARAAATRQPPVLVKIAPDLSLPELDAVIRVARSRGIDGMLVSNTTLARPGLRDAVGHEAGGLSGRPLFAPSTRMLAQTYVRVEGAFPLIGIGGIDSAQSAYVKLRAGAALVQLYTGLVYEGPALVARMKQGLVDFCRRDGLASITQATGADAAAMAH